MRHEVRCGRKRYGRGGHVHFPGQDKIDIGRPSRAFPVTPPGIRVRTTAVLVKQNSGLPKEQNQAGQSSGRLAQSSGRDYSSRAMDTSHPSGCVEDLHLQAAKHARHTKKGRRRQCRRPQKTSTAGRSRSSVISSAPQRPRHPLWRSVEPNLAQTRRRPAIVADHIDPNVLRLYVAEADFRIMRISIRTVGLGKCLCPAKLDPVGAVG